MKLIANLLLFLVVIIWGSSFFILKNSLDFISPFVLIFYRFLIGIIILGIYIVFTRQSLWKDAQKGIYLGIILLLFYLTQTLGLKYTFASNSAFITGSLVVFVPIIEYI